MQHFGVMSNSFDQNLKGGDRNWSTEIPKMRYFGPVSVDNWNCCPAWCVFILYQRSLFTHFLVGLYFKCAM